MFAFADVMFRVFRNCKLVLEWICGSCLALLEVWLWDWCSEASVDTVRAQSAAMQELLLDHLMESCSHAGVRR